MRWCSCTDCAGSPPPSPCDRPRVIESLLGVEVVDVAAGGAHSACITASGELYTWGKGRYGRLGHGDSEDQLKPKLVSPELTGRSSRVRHPPEERWGAVSAICRGAFWDCNRVCVQVDALQGHRVIDVACGSGDAQTLCLSDDDMVWSWGDGDYGKLGRGGSDGCKVPMKVTPGAASRGRRLLHREEEEEDLLDDSGMMPG